MDSINEDFLFSKTDLQNQYNLYRIDFLDHNNYLFILLNNNSKYILKTILKNAHYNCDFILLYSNYIETIKKPDIKRNKHNDRPVFPHDKYDKEILKKTVLFFNKQFNHNTDTQTKVYFSTDTNNINLDFNSVYSKFINYYELLYNTEHGNFYKFNDYANTHNERSHLPFTTVFIKERNLTKNEEKHSLLPTDFMSYDHCDDKTGNDDLIAYNDNDYCPHDILDLNTDTYYIVYCETLKFSSIINKYKCYPNIISDVLKNYFSDNLKIEVVDEVTIANNELDTFKNLFINTHIDGVETLKRRLSYFKNDVQKDKDDKITMENIIQYISKKYIIAMENDSEEYQIKSVELLNEISRYLFKDIMPMGIKNDILTKLCTIGIKQIKKEDGHYFCGMIDKLNKKNLKNDIVKEHIEKMMDRDDIRYDDTDTCKEL